MPAMRPSASTNCFHSSRWRPSTAVPAGGQAIVAAAPLPGAFHPSALNPAALLELVERGVERGEVVGEGAAGLFLDARGQVVAVTGRVLEQGQDDELGAALLGFAQDIGSGCVDMMEDDISKSIISQADLR